jgi:hypothetical protein
LPSLFFSSEQKDLKIIKIKVRRGRTDFIDPPK